jgi:hypothetical protein
LHLLFSVLFWLPFIGFSRRLGSRQILFFCFGPVSANDPFSARHRFQYQGFFCPVPQVLIFIESFIFLLPHAVRFQSTARTGLLLRVRRTRLIPKRVAHPQFWNFLSPLFRECATSSGPCAPSRRFLPPLCFSAHRFLLENSSGPRAVLVRRPVLFLGAISLWPF